MPKAWSEYEKESIKKSLLLEGRKLFEKYGLQKTTIDELVKASKISKGAFYLFYGSKEELYFDILENLEKEIHSTIYGGMQKTDTSKRAIFRKFLNDTIDILVSNPIYGNLSMTDMDYLLRKLPEETVKNHLHNDFERLGSYFGEWMEKGWMRKIDLGSLSGLFLSIVYLVFQRDAIPGINFSGTRELLIAMLTDYLVITD